MTSDKIIGVNSISYPEIRNFAGLNIEGYKYKKIYDIVKIPSFLYYKTIKNPHRFLSNLFWDFGLNNYDLLHFFNSVNIGKRPWISTFERYMPRGVHSPGQFPDENRYINFALKRIVSPSCKKLIAISDYAYRSQVRFLNDFGKYQAEIMDKVVVIHPPQKKLINSIDEKKTDLESLTFTIVGSDFFRKGGKEVLNVFDSLLKEGNKVKLNIISNLSYGDYASKSTNEDFQNVIKIINQHKDIVQHTNLPNQKVLEILSETDIGLLPTYDETYGYSVLECQALGCPVISTNGGALTEINNNEAGWIINVPLVEDGRSIPRQSEEKKKFSDIVEKQLYEIIKSVLVNRSIVKIKGAAALMRIQNEHNIEKHCSKLKSIYDKALTE